MPYVSHEMRAAREQARRDRIVAVRRQEAEESARLRACRREAQKAHHADCAELLRQEWLQERRSQIAVCRNAVRRAQQEEGSAHRAAEEMRQGLRADALVSSSSYKARHEQMQHRILDVRAEELEQRHEQLQATAELRTRKELVAEQERKRASSAAQSARCRRKAEQRRDSAARSRAAVSAAPPGLHAVEQPQSAPRRVRAEDFDHSCYHRMLVGTQILSATSPCVSVMRHKPRVDGDGCVQDNARVTAAKAQEETQRRLESEQRQLEEHRIRNRERAREGLLRDREHGAQQEAAREVAEEERTQRRRRVASVAGDCKFCEEQQAEQRHAQLLEQKLRREFEQLFVRPDRDWHIVDPAAPPPVRLNITSSHSTTRRT
eukprot:TRINITY_DN19228_c0_g1_i1.p1 TRINITY_DN19228_c0_g1~~TRINITY_DN19228_c0_g1_i1.p1  ORF type:complete len:401 (+),score=184.07 TRINITY_DN19228_c0_g1_i1:73-1203(+)